MAYMAMAYVGMAYGIKRSGVRVVVLLANKADTVTVALDAALLGMISPGCVCVCCMLYVTSCMCALHVACCMLCVKCCMLCAAREILRAAFCVLDQVGMAWC